MRSSAPCPSPSMQYCMDGRLGIIRSTVNVARTRKEWTMAAPTRTPRGKWIEQGLRALAAGGPDAVRIEPLAQALGVTRGGFYWHFDDRNALLEEMLDRWERATTEEVAERLAREGGDVRAKLERLLAFTASGVWTTGGWIICARCSAPSAPTRPTSRPAACCSSRC